jgi:uncharacterized membrane protein
MYIGAEIAHGRKKEMNEAQKAKNEPQANRHTSRHIINSLKAKADRKRSLSEKIADWITGTFGSMGFLIVNVLWFSIWIILNLGIIPGLVAFDPFPFGLLTMIVSLEAIVLAIFVLISQNRAEKVDDLREEVDLQVDMIAEEEVTKLLIMVSVLLEKQGIDVSQDAELQAMLSPTNVEKLERILEQQNINNVSDKASAG